MCMSFACRTAASWGLGVSIVSPSKTCCFYRRYKCAASASSEAVHRKVCWLTCCVCEDRRLTIDLGIALVSELAHVPDPTDTYGPHCRDACQFWCTNAVIAHSLFQALVDSHMFWCLSDVCSGCVGQCEYKNQATIGLKNL